MYQVVVERRAEKDLDRLSSSIHLRISQSILALAADPRPPGCRKLVGGSDDWRIRVGDYRVIYQITDAIRVVHVRRVRHRREVYK